jgi:hypothetical protein
MRRGELVRACASKWRGLVIVGLIGLLLASPLAVAAAARKLGRGPARALPAASVERTAQTVHPSWQIIVPDPPGTVPGYTTYKVLDGNQFMLKSLKAGARSFGKLAAGGLAQGLVVQGLGWVLQQWGIGSGIEDQIAEIGHKLNEIQTSLNVIEASTTRLRAELAGSTFANLVSQAAPIVAHVNTGMKDLDFIAHLPANDPTKRKLTEHLLTFIHKDLLFGKQLELADRIGGTAGAHGVIGAAYHVALTHDRLWTLHTSQQVREVVAYYQAAEVRLLMLRVQYMHAHPDTYSGHYIEAETDSVEQMIHRQTAELMPQPGPEVVADTHTHLEWLTSGLAYAATFDKAQRFATDVGSTGLFPVPRYKQGPGGFKIIAGLDYFEVGKGWRLPHGPEVTQLIKGWSDPSGSWLRWLRREAPGLGGVVADAPHGVWTSGIIAGKPIAVDTEGKIVPSLQFDMQRSPFLVRTQPTRYW